MGSEMHDIMAVSWLEQLDLDEIGVEIFAQHMVSGENLRVSLSVNWVREQNLGLKAASITSICPKWKQRITISKSLFLLDV